MKHILTFLCLSISAALYAAEPDTPTFRDFPNPGSDWSGADGHQVDDGRFSWQHYKHDTTGDVVACVAWYAPRLSIHDNAVRQASIETITSSGYAYPWTRKLGQPIADTVRHQIVSVRVRNHSAGRQQNHRAIEYTYVYENADSNARTAMAHGYVVVVGDFTIFVQHTANRVISSDIAQNLVMDLCTAWSAKQTSVPKGWSASISRPDK